MLKKKSLGQHFLHNAHYVRAIADAAEVGEGDLVLEIGPGGGVLTSELLSRGARVVAVEKDARLIPVLTEKFATEIKNKKLTVIEDDALEFDASKLKNFKLVANIPYYITGALFKKFLSGNNQPTTLVFLIQKEVAERIARDPKESILSLSIKAYGTPKFVAKVPKGAFNPPPAVDSAIVLVSGVSRKNFKNKKHEERFFELVKLGFGQKRKLLASNLKKVLKEDVSELFAKIGIEEKARAEDVTLEEWFALALN